MIDDGPRRLGRFIKRDNKRLMDVVALTDFSFEEICSMPIAHFDNPEGSIIYTRMHSKDELEQTIGVNEEMDKEFRRDDQRRPLLRPLDFTGDWRRQKARRLKSVSKLDEEDELELELEYQRKMEANKRKNPNSKSAAAQTLENSEAASDIDSPAAEQNTSGDDEKKSQNLSSDRQENLADTQEPLNNFQMQKQSIDEVSKVIKSLDQQEQTHQNQQVIPEQAQPITKDNFIPIDMQTNNNLNQNEIDTAQQYKKMVEMEDQKKKEMQQLVEEAKATGYREGFQVGEEKAALQIKKTGTELIQNISHVLNELRGLKKQILANVQENFYELSQAIAESLIRRELKVNPDAFADMIKRAIQESITDDQFKVAVHPEYIAKLKQLDLGSLSEAFVPDEKIKPGDFRVDSSMSMIDGNLSQLISDLLKQSEAALFSNDENKKAG